MATTTTNFGWDIPQSTDLVKDGATAIAALGQDIDTALVDLKGGTTGQVLAKASNTDLDYTWTNVDPLTILDAKGDLISATAADTPARLAVGTDGQYLQADSSTATGLKWATLTAGSMTLLSTITASANTTVSFTSIPTTYKQLWIYWKGVYQNTAGGSWGIRLNNISTSVYTYTGIGLINSGTVSSVVSGDGNQFFEVIRNTMDAATPKRSLSNGFFAVLDADKVADHFVIGQTGGLSKTDNASYVNWNGSFYPTTAAAITRIDFIRSASETITGTFELYGVN